ncbi:MULTISPECIES: carotenoid biosynthesis protein [Exiguobacterium]|jgi:putative membrane protein|uniref:Carotenoid biosynthesis protein n=1 Tax=Exiguobacterium chiriqhucha RW-2 TaxID=1345023 RepID=U1LWW3_9BACL|nr:MULTISPECIES: carotenoid biosynthesis protein [Exiguobacterium]ERG67149.1 hypothetical protein M467_07665 [Exiguobacterium chiriqhucha RW-2]MCT4775855.1 carotenoid biosynthesis protein [Exiguobacterium aquaticum]MCT4788859.1 carotenoid biosynthesis protein [Exiguobacterium mexicanum]TCI68942.1 carotenoid biosynthesis protein [Exiguobacterium sp. IPCI3]TCI78439.1 carotenoid biosynthesis protein [Exiguobacterium sp. IPCH1]
MKVYPWIWKWFLVWYVIGVVLVGFDLLPSWLEWANPVFLWLAGAIGGWVIADGVRHARWIVPFIFFGSIAVETLGVKTGFPFSEYIYAEAFGPTVFGVPVTIGAAWLAVIGSSFAVARLFSFKNRTLWLVPFLAVWLDMAIDPVAANVKGYWEWANDGLYYDIPTQNFVGWFGLSLIFSWLLDRFEVEAEPMLLGHGRYLFVMLHALFGVTAVNAGLYGIGVLSLVTAAGLILIERRSRHDRSEQKEMVQ